MTAYREFAQVEYEYVRNHVYASFDWKTFEEPSPRRRLQLPLKRARIALVATAGAHLPDQPPFPSTPRRSKTTYSGVSASTGKRTRRKD